MLAPRSVFPIAIGFALGAIVDVASPPAATQVAGARGYSSSSDCAYPDSVGAPRGVGVLPGDASTASRAGGSSPSDPDVSATGCASR